MLLRTQQRDGRTGLGQAVGVGEAGLREEIQRAGDQFQRHPPAAVGDGLQGRQIRRYTGVHAGDDPGEHRRHHEGVGDALRRGKPEPVVRIEGRQQHDAALRVDGAEQRRDAGDVIGRHAHERRFVRSGRAKLYGAEDVRQQIRMAQYRRLRRRGGAAGEQLNGDRVVGFVRRNVGFDPLFRGADKCGAGPGHAALVGGESLNPAHVADEAGGCDALEQRSQIGVGEPVVERHIRDAGNGCTE